ncbi:MAG: hypothetical protein PHI85_10490 [Victivallaceae bacterium]|nr:hypothetical protein [Victivallaceae bacterium]
MNCYGHYDVVRSDCRACKLIRYCREAGDPPLMVASMPSFDDELAVPGRCAPDVSDTEDYPDVYTRDDLLEVISFMLQLDVRAVELISRHVETPGITFRQLGESRNVTRQAVHKFLKNQCRKFPEIAALLRIGERRRSIIKRKTFMEAVCLIRRKMCASRWSAPRKSLLCWRKLICSTESSNSFSTNILKGAGLWRGGSRK